MSEGIRQYLALAKTPQEREEMKERLLRLMEMRDEDIDFSDIPKITDFSRFVRAKPHFDAIREHNLRVKAERAHKLSINTLESE